MAEYATVVPIDADDLNKEACDRLDQARKQKAQWQLDIREGYAFACAQRNRNIDSASLPMETRRAPDDQILADASGLTADFATEMIDAFMPEAEPWAKQEAGIFLGDAIAVEIDKAAQEQDEKIFKAIKASNLYTVLPMAFDPDLAAGTTALWIDDPMPGQNFVCQAIPLSELEINIGPHGEIDDRFAVRHTKNRHVKALVGEAIYQNMPAMTRRRIDDKPDGRTAIAWGYWRDWSERGDVVWQHVVLCDKEKIHDVKIRGVGCCPLIPMRFNPLPEWSYGNGPLIKSLRWLRLLDTLLVNLLDHIDLRLRPPIAYPDDGIAAIEQGIESGAAYPVRPGSADAIKPIFEGGDIDAALFQTADVWQRLRRNFYVDYPEQPGKTPPTRTQWLDEVVRAQRRIGMPGKSFWREGPAEIFLRFKYLLEKRKVIAPVMVEEVDGAYQLSTNGKTIALSPFNPAQRAAEQQEVNQAVQFAGIASGLWPEEWRIASDGGESMRALAEKMRVGGLIKWRSPEQQKAAVAQIAQLTGVANTQPPPEQ